MPILRDPGGGYIHIRDPRQSDTVIILLGQNSDVRGSMSRVASRARKAKALHTTPHNPLTEGETGADPALELIQMDIVTGLPSVPVEPRGRMIRKLQ